MIAEIIKRSHYLEVEINKTKEERSDHQSRIDQLDSRLLLLDAWWQELKPHLCSACNGFGRIREWYAQDESKLVDCGRCGGTGAAT